MGDEGTAQPHQRASHQSEERLDLVVAELDSLLDALGDIGADQTRAPDVTGRTEVEPTTPLSSAPSGVGRPQSVPAGAPPTERPTTRLAGAREERADIDDPAGGIASGRTETDGGTPASPTSRNRRLVIFAVVLLVAIGMAVLIGDTLGGLIGGGAGEGGEETEQTSQSPPTVEIVTHRFSGTGTSTTDWFTAGTEFRAIWEEAPETVSEVALETESGTRITITPESGTADPTFFPPDTYHLIVETDDPWVIRLVRVVTD